MSRPRLSVVCLSHHPGRQVVAALAPLREVAEEIIVAADAKVPASELGGYAQVADRLLRIEVGYFERTIGWLLAQCTGEWILRLDGDEVVSTALLDALPGMLADDEVFQYWLPRRWLFGDRDSWLAGLPWWPDYNNRLVRAGAAAHHPGIMHAPITPVGPARHIEAPIYHLTLLTDSPAERAARALRQEVIRPGLVAPGGGPVNGMFYLPEGGGDHLTDGVPEADRALIAAALDPASAPPAPDPLPPVITAAERDAATGRGEMNDADYACELATMERDHRAVAGWGHALHVLVTNRGDVTWPVAGDAGPEIRLVHRWLRAGEPIDAEEPRHGFPVPVPPGGRRIVPLELMAPAAPGEYELEIRLVHEHVRWFAAELRLATAVTARSEPRPVARRRRWGGAAATSGIPPILHLGPVMGDEGLADWRAAAPGWEVRRWDEAALVALLAPGEHPAAGRFAALLAHGGVWVEPGLPARPIGPLAAGVDGFAFASEADGDGVADARLIGARAGHPAIRRAREIARGLGAVDLDPIAGAGLALGMAIAAASGFALYARPAPDRPA